MSLLHATVPPPIGLRIAPGPRGFLPSLSMPAFSGPAPHERMVRDANKYGDVVRYLVGPFVLHQLRNPDHVRHVLAENHANYTKGRGIQKMRVFLGNGLLTSEGDFWKRQRRLAQPAFHRQRLARLTEVMVRCGHDLLARLEATVARAPDEPVEMLDEMMRVTLRIVGLGLFGSDTEGAAEAVGRALSVALEHTNERVRTVLPIPLKVPTRRNREFHAALRTLNDLVFGIIAERRKSGADAGDLLSMLMAAKDEDTGESMSDQQLRDEIMTLVLAGHETTANALTWTFHLLSRHPAVMRTLQAELEAVLEGRAPTFEDLARLRYTRMVLEESMRLFPPAWAFGRRATHDDAVGPYFVPAGSLVIVSTYVLHRNPALWPNPEGFDPERFAPEQAAGRHKYAYLPFGGGPRICIGNAFAMMEGQILLAMLAQRWRLDLSPGHRVEPQPMITMRPKFGMRMILRPA